MSIAVLAEVFNETRRLSIAGSGLASGDFRLKKLVDPLKKAAEKAPVFGKVAQAITKVIESDERSASGALLELSTLVTAILYTQGKTGAEGALKPIETSGLAMPTAASGARVLKPLIEALTTTGSGRMEIIQDAFRRGAFKDLRLVKPALAAIDDVYGEIGDFVADTVLPIYGRAILPELRASYDIKGKSGQVRRLRLMNRLDPEGTQDQVEKALASGSKEMKVAAIRCLKDSKGHLSYMLEQTRAKAKEVRAAAFSALARFTDNEVVDSLIKAFSGGDIELAAGPVSENRSPKLLAYLLEEGRKRLDVLLALKDKAKLNKALNGFHQFLGGFVSRGDPQSTAFLIHCFDRREEIGKRKGSTSDGDEINVQVVSLMVRSNDKTAQKALIDAHESLAPSGLGWALVAAMRTRPAKQVFKLFSPYYTAKTPSKRGRNPVRERREIVQETLCGVASRRQYWHYDLGWYDGLDGDEFAAMTKDITLDPAWLDAAVAAEDLTAVCALAQPKHKKAERYLVKTVDQLLAKSGDGADHECAELIATMIRIGHPKAVASFLKALEKAGNRKTRYASAWWVLRLAQDLPVSAAPKIEALLPKLNEKIIDEALPYLEALKSK